MQRKIDNDIKLRNIVPLFDSIGASSATDRTASNFSSTTEKVQKIRKLLKNW